MVQKLVGVRAAHAAQDLGFHASYRRHTTDMALDDYAAQVGGSLDALTRRFNSGERSNR